MPSGKNNYDTMQKSNKKGRHLSELSLFVGEHFRIDSDGHRRAICTDDDLLYAFKCDHPECEQTPGAIQKARKRLDDILPFKAPGRPDDALLDQQYEEIANEIKTQTAEFDAAAYQDEQEQRSEERAIARQEKTVEAVRNKRAELAAIKKEQEPPKYHRPLKYQIEEDQALAYVLAHTHVAAKRRTTSSAAIMSDQVSTGVGNIAKGTVVIGGVECVVPNDMRVMAREFQHSGIYVPTQQVEELVEYAPGSSKSGKQGGNSARTQSYSLLK